MSLKALPLGMVAALALLAATPFESAVQKYQRTDYQGALQILTDVPQKDAATWALIGKAQFMSADYKKATEAFEKAAAADPKSSEYVHWLGRSWGRRAESANPFSAATWAARARSSFERALMLDPRNKEALNDLFDYCLEAPGFLGGGFTKAEGLVHKIAQLDEAEGHYALAQLADRRKEFDKAEQQLRRALELAPRQLGRVLDLAKYVSKRGRVQESEALFAQAENLAPNSPRILYERAETYIRDKRNLDQAKQLLKKYLASTLTADDPPRLQAEELLKKANGA